MALTSSPSRGPVGFVRGVRLPFPSLVAAPALAPLLLLLLLPLLLAPAAAPAASLPPGATPCLGTNLPAGYGSFFLVKQATSQQSGDTAPTAVDAVARIDLVPPSAYAISNAIVTGPSSFKANLTRQAGGSSTWSEAGAEAVLLPRLPSGAWNTSFQLAFTNGDSFIGFFPFLLVSNVPPIPRIANLAAAQSVDSRTAFNLSWNVWIASGTHDRINLTLTDPSGAVVVSAASDCSGEGTLSSGATSFEIPAGRLAANTTYSGHLTFAASLLAAQDDSTLIVERALESRTTRFSLKTAPTSAGGSPGTFQNPTVTGTNLVFLLKGTAGDVQRIESTPNFTTWTTELQVTIPAPGSLEVKLPLPADGLPRFYRTVTVGGSTPTGEPATLSIVLRALRELDITVRGTPGSAYDVERSLNGVTWTNVASTVIPTDGTPQVVYVTVPEGENFLLVRAVNKVAAPPAEIKPPTLGISILTPTFGPGANFVQLRISLMGGTPRKNYSIQQKSTLSPAALWTTTPQGVATDINGNGGVTLVVPRSPAGSPNGASAGTIYRAFSP